MQKLANSKGLTPNDPQQTFYRKIEQHPLKQLAIIKLGWKIKDLPKEEQELALLCFNFLSA